MASLNDLLYDFLKRITAATTGATEDLAISALLTALDPEFALSTQLPEGGTAGQILAKTSSTDYDAEWIDSAGDKYVRATWFAEISSGTSGTVTPPTGSTIVLNAWSGGIDALVSTMSGAGSLPLYTTAVTSTSVPVTATLDVDGNWTLSGTPSAYPVSLIYVYRTALTDLDDSKSLSTVEVEEDKIIRGQRDLRTDLTPADGATATLDCSLGNAFKITAPDTGAGMDFTITLSNVPSGTVYHAIEVAIVVGTNIPTISYTNKGTNVTAPTLTASRTNIIIISTWNNGTTLMLNSAGTY